MAYINVRGLKDKIAAIFVELGFTIQRDSYTPKGVYHLMMWRNVDPLHEEIEIEVQTYLTVQSMAFSYSGELGHFNMGFKNFPLWQNGLATEEEFLEPLRDFARRLKENDRLMGDTIQILLGSDGERVH